MAGEMTLTGMDALLNKIDAMGKAGTKIAGVALTTAAQPLATDMRSLVNVSTEAHRHLRDNIIVGKVKTVNGMPTISIGPGKKTFWGMFLEWGTSKESAHPFMAPAYEQNKEEIQRIISQQLREALGL
jgi:HK97 gp10 family phage protein